INFPLEQALSGRYSTPVLIYWAVTIVLCLAVRPATLWWRRPVFGVGLALLAVFSMTLIPYQIAEVNRWIALTDKVNVGAVTLLVGVQDDDAVRFVFPDPPLARLVADVLRAHGLSIYGGRRAGLLGRLIGEAARPARPEPCSGAGDPATVAPLPSDQQRGFRVSRRV